MELGAWRGEGVRVGQVLDALAELRRGEQRTATRTSVTNFVLVAGDHEEADLGCTALHRLGGRHPGRTVVLVARPDAGPAGLDASVTLHGTVAEGHAVWSEDVRLEVRGEPAAHLDSLLEPLTLADLPVVVWFSGAPPSPAEPLLASADAVVVDTREGDVAALAAVAALDRRCVVHDVAWIALRPWRQLVAGLFDPAPARPLVAGVDRVEVRGEGTSPLLLGGWLASRLGLACSAVELRPGPGAGVRLEAGAGGVRGSFSVERVDGEAALRAVSSVDGAPPHEERLSLPDDPLGAAVGEALTRVGRDRAHGQALRAALVFRP
ncbi:MAG: glucose-6-phosphate dehydrogenase assembly protein OpcA [Actinomycetota bacterium]|nr:glucose-6-phosphate dehydrogenase assembly protein OpcA [Actinomycetota bacterium]